MYLFGGGLFQTGFTKRGFFASPGDTGVQAGWRKSIKKGIFYTFPGVFKDRKVALEDPWDGSSRGDLFQARLDPPGGRILKVIGCFF